MTAAPVRRAPLWSWALLVACNLFPVLAPAAEAPPSASEILQELSTFRECGSVLYIAAHPDDENTQFIAYLAKERGMRVGYLSLTRGEGGQNLIGPELGDALGVIRTQELLAARRIDGGQQFFTRARDFGYSKSSEQTLAKWDRQEVLSDIVRVIRTFRPDVIVTRFPPEPGGTHGHHTASSILALEAFKAAGDPKAFTGQDGEKGSAQRDRNGQPVPEPGGEIGLGPWQPERLFWNAFRSGDPARPIVRMDIGGYLSLLGLSVGEIAALSRSCHRSQGFGSIASRGFRLDEFQPLDGQPAGKDLFAGIDTTWARHDGFKDVGTHLDGIIARFNPRDPAASVPALLAVSRLLSTQAPGTRREPREQRWLDEKCRHLNRIIQACLGLYVETTVQTSAIVPGEKLKMRHTVILRSNMPVRWLGVEGSRYGRDAKLELHPDQPVVLDAEFNVPGDLPLTQPYWLRGEGSRGMYRVDDPSLIGQPENPPAIPLTFVFEMNGERFEVLDQPVQVTVDPTKGEIRRKLDVIPPVSLAMAHDVQLFASGADRVVQVELKAYRDNPEGELRLTAPPGWKVTPDSQPFHLAASGDHAYFAFTVTAPPTTGTAQVIARATVDGKTYSTSRQEIRYEHIPPQLLQPPARVKTVCLDLAIRGKRVGYLPGAGDRTAESLEQMGYEVTTLSGVDLTVDRLKDFDAVVIGIRAFNVRTDLAPGLSALFAYVENGGNVIEQYNTPGELKTPRLAPYDLTLSRNLPQNRVTDEKALVTILAPDHPVFNTPNRITPADFDGWVQERGLNFPGEWDHDHFTALLACGDPGESPLQSGLLVAHHGKGYFVYTGLSFFRQLPAGVPGAYRLFANLVSLGK